MLLSVASSVPVDLTTFEDDRKLSVSFFPCQFNENDKYGNAFYMIGAVMKWKLA